MATVLITSVESYAGKTAVAIGLIAALRKAGVSSGYMKPIGTNIVTVDGLPVDQDAVFVSRMLGIDEPANIICPVLLTQELREKALRQRTDVSSTVLAAYQQLIQRWSVLVMEGSGSLSAGYIMGLAPDRLAELTDASVVAVLRYSRDMSPDDVILVKKFFRERLAGVIINSIPDQARQLVQDQFGAHLLQREGIRLLGMLPFDGVLNSISVGDLVKVLNGRILCHPEKQDDLVATFSIGAMSAGSALRYFMQSSQKAVITGGDRSEIQMAALQTSTTCIILTGGLHPASIVLARADELGVPMILVEQDTRATVEIVESTLGHIRLSSSQQVERLKTMIDNDVDIPTLRQILHV
jgi:uncharacterized protein